MVADRDAAVGVFDSGIGGLTVAKEIIRQLPGESVIYFGDTPLSKVDVTFEPQAKYANGNAATSTSEATVR